MDDPRERPAAGGSEIAEATLRDVYQRVGFAAPARRTGA